MGMFKNEQRENPRGLKYENIRKRNLSLGYLTTLHKLHTDVAPN
jgi:hypothetical protein